MLWADKHRPVQLSKLELHSDVNNKLSRLIQNPRDFPHLLVYGPPGSGKGVRIHCLLRSLFGPSIDRRKVHHKSFKVGSSKTIELSLIGSIHHIELNPSEVGPFNDRHVVQEVIKEIASTSNVSSMSGNSTSTDATASSSSAAIDLKQSQQSNQPSNSASYKIVVLTEVDHLSLQAQQALRRTMEQFTQNCRLILVANSITKVIGPLRSRCLGIRIGAPSMNECRTLLRQISDKESLSISDSLLDRLIESSQFNLRRAILCLEASRVRYAANATTTTSSNQSSNQQVILSDTIQLPLPDWIELIDVIARMICEEQSSQRLLLVRTKFYELLSNCIPASVVLRQLTLSLLRRCDDLTKTKVMQLAAEYDSRMAVGSKAIFHLEAFVAKFMAEYKQWVLTTFG